MWVIANSVVAKVAKERTIKIKRNGLENPERYFLINMIYTMIYMMIYMHVKESPQTMLLIQNNFTAGADMCKQVVGFAVGIRGLYQVLEHMCKNPQATNPISVQVEWLVDVADIPDSLQAFKLLSATKQLFLDQLQVNVNLSPVNGKSNEDEEDQVNEAKRCIQEYANYDLPVCVRVGRTPFVQVLDSLTKRGEDVRVFAGSPQTLATTKHAIENHTFDGLVFLPY
ncbi:hypothetical protein BASA81_006314 [Batrachochytrium salamandrivorans]|nr:hypothetical protein BASA81_006314 [Batrachochytrium salamandrivorans]